LCEHFVCLGTPRLTSTLTGTTSQGPSPRAPTPIGCELLKSRRQLPRGQSIALGKVQQRGAIILRKQDRSTPLSAANRLNGAGFDRDKGFDHLRTRTIRRRRCTRRRFFAVSITSMTHAFRIASRRP
jgi:hypothetical protein